MSTCTRCRILSKGAAGGPYTKTTGQDMWGSGQMDDSAKNAVGGTAFLTTQSAIPAELAHARLGDTSVDTLVKMSQHQTAAGLVIQQNGQNEACKVCIEANLKHSRVPRTRTRTNLRPLEIVGCDLQEYETISCDGGKYLAIYVDHDTGFLATVVLKHKNDQERAAPDVIHRLERLSGRKIDILRADQGGEYTSDAFRAQIRSMGIKLEYSDTARAHQNGLAEVIGGKITRMMRAARVRSGVLRRYWSENARYQTCIHNRVSLRR